MASFSFGVTLPVMKNAEDIASALGMPDHIDKARIQMMINQYERENPGEIAAGINEAREYWRVEGGRKQEYGEVNKQARGRMMLALPPALHAKIEDYIPTIFRSKKHFRWFCKEFKGLLLPEKL